MSSKFQKPSKKNERKRTIKAGKTESRFVFVT